MTSQDEGSLTATSDWSVGAAVRREAADPGAGKRFASPMLHGRHVYLRTVMPEDVATIQLMETSDALAIRWRLRGSTPGPGQWADVTNTSVLAQFLVVARTRHAHLGLVVFYKPNFQYDHAYLAATSFTPRTRS